MGLFGSILSGLGGLVGGIFGANDNKNAIKSAASAQTGALNRAIDLENAQYQQTRQDYLPYTTAGASAIGSAGDLTGANGNDKWQAAITALQGSPLYKSLFNNGQETVLQNAAATGGIRGGNTQNALAQFGENTLSQTIQQQLANLMGVAGIGAGVTTNQGALGAANAANVGNQTVGIGQVQAGSVLGQQQVWNNLSSQLSKLVSTFIPGGGLSF